MSSILDKKFKVDQRKAAGFLIVSILSTTTGLISTAAFISMAISESIKSPLTILFGLVGGLLLLTGFLCCWAANLFKEPTTTLGKSTLTNSADTPFLPDERSSFEIEGFSGGNFNQRIQQVLSIREAFKATPPISLVLNIFEKVTHKPSILESKIETRDDIRI